MTAAADLLAGAPVDAGVLVLAPSQRMASELAGRLRRSGRPVSYTHLDVYKRQGFRCTAIPAFSVQYHPEAGPGPHDARYLFADFRALMTSVRP